MQAGCIRLSAIREQAYVVLCAISCAASSKALESCLRFSLGPFRHGDEPVPEGSIVLIRLEGGHVEGAQQLITLLVLIRVVNHLYMMQLAAC